MGKRQRSENRDDGASPTEATDETQTVAKMNGGESCVHILNAVDLPTIRKQIKSCGFDKQCGYCAQAAVIHSAYEKKFDGGTGVDCMLWLCLKCGSQLCGIKKSRHALQHYSDSDGHALAMNTSTFAVWCFCCDAPVNQYDGPTLHDIVELAKQEAIKLRDSTGTRAFHDQNGQVKIATQSMRKLKFGELQSPPMTSIPLSAFDVPDARMLDGNTQPNKNQFVAGAGSSTTVGVVGAIAVPPSQATHQLVVEGLPFAMPASDKPNVDDPLPRLRGLSNLGNTCFFNAVLQCLARTPYLLSILNETAVVGEKVHIPGGALKLPDGTEKVLPSIDGELDPCRSLTAALAATLTDLNRSATSVVSPDRLLDELTNKWPQFAGGEQHDAHELLRHLLESVRTDDLRRYQALILHSLGLDKRKNQLNVDETQKAMVRFYGEQISQWVFRPEQVFRGSLVSTLTCQDCQHTSSRHEYFLDVSLPVCVEKPQQTVRRRASPEPAGRNGMTLIALPGPASAVPPASTETNMFAVKALSKKERDMEKKAKRMAKHQKNRINLSSVGIGSGAAFPSPLPAADTASASDTDADMPPMLPLTDDVPGGGAGADESSDDPSDADVEDNDLPEDLQTDKKKGEGEASNGHTVDQNGNQAQPRSTVPEKVDDSPEIPNKEPVDGSSSNIVCAVGISAHRASQIARHNQLADGSETNGELMKPADAGPDGPRGRQRTYSHADWSNTVAPRYQCKDGEYSVQSCFNNFTGVELMMGNNKVCCEACTERINGKDGKSVNTNATKQFLISVPPAVLILHLKRFQVGPRGMFSKLTDSVTFPFVLDIAPFCGSKVKRASHIRPGQKKILYSLYGLVEHTGSMQNGHYVAYVKVRPPFGPDDVRWKFIPQGTKDELDRKSEQEMAKEQALRMGVHLHDSDDSLNSESEADAVDEIDGPYSHCQVPQQQQQQQQQQQRVERQEEEEEEEGAVGYRPKPPETVPEVEPPPGKWYFVSDRQVREVPEESVLKVHAYLLFYERIF